MANLNKVMLIGRLGQDPEVKDAGNTPVANFSIATNENWTDKSGEKQERTEWHNIVAWDKLADLAGNYLRRGSNIYCEGKLQTRSWESQEGEKKYRTEVVINQLQFLDKREDNNTGAEPQQYAREEPQQKPVNDQSNIGRIQSNFQDTGKKDDIPF
jgi:single-strand DNA-binding protein